MPESILIADDDPAMRRLYTRIFSETNYSITIATSVAEARGFIETNHYDLLVTDLMFPDGLGTELVKLLKRSAHTLKACWSRVPTPRKRARRRRNIRMFRQTFQGGAFHGRRQQGSERITPPPKTWRSAVSRNRTFRIGIPAPPCGASAKRFSSGGAPPPLKLL